MGIAVYVCMRVKQLVSEVFVVCVVMSCSEMAVVMHSAFVICCSCDYVLNINSH